MKKFRWGPLILGLVLLFSCVSKYTQYPYQCIQDIKPKNSFKLNIEKVIEEYPQKILVKFHNGDTMWINKSYIVCSSNVYKYGDTGTLVITRPYAAWKGFCKKVIK